MPTETKELAEQSAADAAATRRAATEKMLTDSLVALLPRQVDPTRFTAFAVAIMRSSDLADCTEKSKMLALSDCAKMGLFPDPNLGHVYLVPFNNNIGTRQNPKYAKEVTVIIGYQGMIELARRSGFITTVHTAVVRDGDDFTYWTDDDGPHLRHVPLLDVTKPITHAYCIAKLKSGEKQIEVMPMADIEKHRARSKSKDSGPWKTDTEMMIRKTPVRVGRKYWPQSPELALAGALDDVADGLYDRKHVDNIARGTLASAPTGRISTKPEPETAPPVDDQWRGEQQPGSVTANEPKTTRSEPKPDAKTEETKASDPPKEESSAVTEPAQTTDDGVPVTAEGRQQWLARVAMKSAGRDDEQMAMSVTRRWMMTNSIAPSHLNKDGVFNPAREQVKKIDWKPAFDEWAAAAAAKEGGKT